MKKERPGPVEMDERWLDVEFWEAKIETVRDEHLLTNRYRGVWLAGLPRGPGAAVLLQLSPAGEVTIWSTSHPSPKANRNIPVSLDDDWPDLRRRAAEAIVECVNELFVGLVEGL